MKIGDKVRHDITGKVGTLTTYPTLSDMCTVEYGDGPIVTWKKRLELLPTPARRVKNPKPTATQIALRDDPDVLNLIWQLYKGNGRVLISCQGSKVEYLASQVSGITSLSETEAMDYISPASEKTHAMKFYVMLPAGAEESFYQRVSIFFGSRTTKASTSEVQYNSRDLAEWLMKEHSILPEKRS